MTTIELRDNARGAALVKQTVVGTFLTLVLMTQPFAKAAGSEESPDVDVTKTETTILAMRDVGAAIFAWLTENHSEPPPGVTPQRIAKVESVDWSQCPRVSHAQLTNLLVPRYIHEIPSLDGWGNPLEFCLDRANPFTGTYLVGIRSSGRDGRFDDTPFRRGSFDPRDFDRDIVWLDAFFVAWPKGSEPLHRRELPAFAMPGDPG